MSTASRFLVAAAAVLAAAACDSAPTEPNGTAEPAPRPAFEVIQRGPTQHWIEERISDMDGVVGFIECPDGSESEGIRLSGKLYTKETLLVNPAGVHVFKSNVMPVGLSGVGVVSGEEFRASERSHSTGVQLEKRTMNRFRTDIDFFGKESRRRFRMVIMGTVVWDENGDPIVEKTIERFECSA